MVTLGVREIRASYTVLVDTLKQEGEVVLTHHGKPFARVLPINPVEATAKREPLSMQWLHAQMPMLAEGTDQYLQAERDAR